MQVRPGLSEPILVTYETRGPSGLSFAKRLHIGIC